MTVHQEIKELEKNGKLKRFISLGIIPLKVNHYYNMYNTYLRELEKNRRCNDCVMTSISNTGSDFKTSQNSVYRAINFMQSE